jgi:ribosomal-protein-alanine N-acetyltransferase
MRLTSREFVLRACEFKDLSQVGRVEEASFPDSPYSRLDFVSSLLDAREGFIVACEGDLLVVGYVIATRGQTLDGSIQSIAVLPEFRERGVGGLLIRSAIDHLASGGCRRVFLLVDSKNERAIRLYRRFYFSETGLVIRKYYPNGGDAVEMERRL